MELISRKTCQMDHMLFNKSKKLLIGVRMDDIRLMSSLHDAEASMTSASRSVTFKCNRRRNESELQGIRSVIADTNKVQQKLTSTLKKESSPVFPQNTKGVVSGFGYPMCWIFYVPNHPNLVYFQYKPLWNMAFTMAYSMDSMDSSRHSKNDKFPCVLLLAPVGHRNIWVG